jgi:hypothetical protein
MAIHIQRREFTPPQFLQALVERRNSVLAFLIVRSPVHGIISLSSMAAWPMAALAQQTDRMRRGIILAPASVDPNVAAMKPVALPPGRARLATKPAPTGSVTPAKTIGKARLTCCSAATLTVPLAKMMSGASATNSVAYLR